MAAKKQIELPRHVCFKGDNGKFLSSRIINGLPYQQFSESDIGAPSVRFTTYYNGDGTFRVKANNLGKFWRRSPNWIWADADAYSTRNNPDTLFRAVKIDGNTVALKNLGNGHFCHRLTCDNKDSCLNATIPSIRNEARLQLHEPLISRSIYDIEYRLQDAKIYNSKVLTMMTDSADNHSSKDNKETLNLRYTVTTAKKWDSTKSWKVGGSITIEGKIPEVLDGKIEISGEYGESDSWGKTITTTQELSNSYVVTVPPHTRVIVSVLATQATCDVPFSYYQEDVLLDGETVVQKFDDGLYRGVNYYGFRHQVKEQKLG